MLYQRSWDWVLLSLVRGLFFTLLLLVPLWAGASQAQGINPWWYALRVGIPLGFLTTFPTVSIERWAVQRRMTWFATLTAAYLSVMGGWSLGLLLGNAIHQAGAHGTEAVTAWLRNQFIALVVTPSLWLIILLPPLAFAVASVLHINIKKRGIWILSGLTLLSFIGLLFLRGGPPRPLLFLTFIQAPLTGTIFVIYVVSEKVMEKFRVPGSEFRVGPNRP